MYLTFLRTSGRITCCHNKDSGSIPKCWKKKKSFGQVTLANETIVVVIISICYYIDFLVHVLYF